jgi:hypothetical protein
MNWILLSFLLLWLGFLSWHDIHHQEIPHSLWVIIPLLFVCGYRVWIGDGWLVLFIGIILAVSERERISSILKIKAVSSLASWFPWLLIGMFFSVQSQPVITVAILGFWVAWELRIWGGADTLIAMVLILVLPAIPFLVSFFLVHLMIAIGMRIVQWSTHQKNEVFRIPGIPLLIPCVLLVNLFGNLIHY